MRRLALAATLVALGACNPPPMTDDAAPTASENAARSPIVRMAAATKPVLVDGDPIHLVTTTTSPLRPATTVPPTTAPPAPTPTSERDGVSSSGSGGNCSGWGDLIADYFPGEESTACRVFIGCESKGDPNAVSPTGDHGLAQVNEATWRKPGHSDPVADWIGRHWHDVYDPATNLEMARRIRAAYGWRMWSCY